MVHMARRVLGFSVTCVLLLGACGSEPRRPEMPPGDLVEKLRLRAGNIVQDCGTADEFLREKACTVRPIGECLAAARKECRVAHGVRRYFSGEGDGVRVDWLVLKNDTGSCDLVEIVDRSSDPLAKEKITHETCRSVEWSSHPELDDCLLPVLKDCKKQQVAAPKDE